MWNLAPYPNSQPIALTTTGAYASKGINFSSGQEVGLGDIIESALTKVGIDKSLVTKWLGAPCGCEERREKLNALDFWARRVVKGHIDKAKEYLEGILGGKVDE